MHRFLRDNGLGLVFGALFLLTLVGQEFAGKADVNYQQLANGGQALGHPPGGAPGRPADRLQIDPGVGDALLHRGEGADRP